MGGRYYKNITSKLTINLDKDREQNTYNFIFNGMVHFDFDAFKEVINIIEKLLSIENLKEKRKSINLNDLVSFQRDYVLDVSSEFDYIFRIKETEKNRRVSHTVEIMGTKQLKAVKNALSEIYEKFQADKWLEEKIREEGTKSVEYNGKRIDVEINYGRLNLSNLGIKKISNIIGIDKIVYLKMLNFNNNEIEEIEGLDHLVHLRQLTLANNYIKEIKGLENLMNLETLSFFNNPIKSLNGLENLENLTLLNMAGTSIPKDLFREVGITNPERAQDLIKYHNKKKENELKYEETKCNTLEYIQKAAQVFEEITFSKIISKTGIKLQDLEEMVEDLIFSEKINAKIRKDGIVFIEENPLIDIALETVDVLYGIKDDTQLISQYTSYIEDVFDKTENIEEYLKCHLASEFEKIQNSWQDYKEGKIEKREFIKIGIREIGKKFVKIFLKKI